MTTRGAAVRGIVIALLSACGGGGGGSSPDARSPDAHAAPDAAVPRIDPVTGFTATAGAARTIHLAWTNPASADLAGVLVVRGAGVTVDFTPTDGTTYNVGDPAGTGEDVVNTAVGTSLDTDAVPGLAYHYAAWAFDSAHRYSTIALADGVNNALGTQSATLTVSLANSTVTVTQAPADFTLSGTDTFASGTSTLTVHLTTRNDTGRLLFNLKAATDTINQGAQGAPVLPMSLGALPYVYLGPAALDVGASASADLVITGVDGTVDPITIDLHYLDAPMVYGGGWQNSLDMVDSSGAGQAAHRADCPARSMRQLAISPDGHFLYMGDKRGAKVDVVDTTTYTSVQSADLSTTGVGNIGGLVLSNDGSKLYAIVNEGGDWHGSNQTGGDMTPNGPGFVPVPTGIELVELDRATLTQTRSVTLRTADATSRMGHHLALSPDGTRATVVAAARDTENNEIWFVNLTTMQLEANQPVALTQAVKQVERSVWSDDGTKVYVLYNTKGQGANGANVPAPLDVLDATTYAATPVTVAAGGRAGSISAARSGSLYYASRAQATGTTMTALVKIDESSGAQTTIAGPTVGNGIVFDPSGTRYYVLEDQALRVFDAATDTEIDTDGDATNGVTPLTAATNSNFYAHGAVVSPF